MHSRRVQLSNTVELDISISIHALPRSATVDMNYTLKIIKIFQFMHSHGVQPLLMSLSCKGETIFQFMHSRRVQRILTDVVIRTRRFQFMHSRRVQPQAQFNNNLVRYISIHALTQSATTIKSRSNSAKAAFQFMHSRRVQHIGIVFNFT